MTEAGKEKGMSLNADTYASDDVRTERFAQDAKWGEQNHDPVTWLAILSEEVGEFAQEALNLRFGKDNKTIHRLRAEAVQVAAVALAIVECLDRQKWQAPPGALDD